MCPGQTGLACAASDGGDRSADAAGERTNRCSGSPACTSSGLIHPVPEDDPGRWLLSCTVLTTTTQDALGHVHDRSPVIIPRDRFAEWLDPDLTDKNDIQHLLDSFPEPTLTPGVPQIING
ncbi:SOS response-associated peptidase family protein [Arthrobacter globiformis]|uniref:SOS response-associated peptidase family protein n=1 Tax=Arthrobacter globiformis TaxID=1665 RepID=UPI0027D8373B|nr:SOS response-associated peptidase family protein [Arthrobacter globiformis]